MHDDSQAIFSPADAEAIAWEQFDLQGSAEKLPGERDLNFLVTTSQGKFVLKIAHPDNSVKRLEAQNQAMALCQPLDKFKSPHVIKSQQRQSIVPKMVESGEVWSVRCLTYVQGTPLGTIEASDPRRNDTLFGAIGRLAARLDDALVPVGKVNTIEKFQWDLKNAPATVRQSEILQEKSSRSEILICCLENFQAIESRLDQLPSSTIHNDLNDYNLLVPDRPDADGNYRLGVIDFGDLIYSKTINNLAICLAYCTLGMPKPLETASVVVGGYNQIRFLSANELSVLFPLLCLRLAQSVCISHEQGRLHSENEYLTVSQKPAWAALEKMAGLDPREVSDQFSDACREPGRTISDTGKPDQATVKGIPRGKAAEIFDRRKQLLAPSLSLSYEKPLHIVRGKGQYLYDANDVTYLDCVNNVCHVGHCHPDVAAAAAAQIGLLNTNTRYLHENIVELASKLTNTMRTPSGPQLEVCFFVNSGSEANDLALRLARNFTGHHDICVIDHAYHGHVSSLIEISPYKFNSAGGRGKPEHTHVLPIPDTYRGEFKATDAAAVESYLSQADDVIDQALASRRSIAAMIAEPILSCGGQVPLPTGYLAGVYKKIRQLGGVCISDEVQVGFGRTGSDLWGYQHHKVVPDIVTMGKPFGNGHPLAAVVTTREIAESFNNGMEYFNTFGGNPVSCAIGLTVMDVIVRESLQQNALETGTWLVDEFKKLQQRFELVGDVRGSGFFLGLEFVEDRRTLKPAKDAAKRIVNMLRDKSILLSTDGPHENVIKFKPPMVFTQGDAERVAWALEKVLERF